VQEKKVPRVKKDGEITLKHNSEMIRILSHKIDDFKDLIEKLIKDYPPPLKE
jgi:hypothetical protein